MTASPESAAGAGAASTGACSVTTSGAGAGTVASSTTAGVASVDEIFWRYATGSAGGLSSAMVGWRDHNASAAAMTANAHTSATDSLSVPARIIGRTGGAALRVEVDGKTAIDVSVEEAERVWSTAIDKYFVKRVA